MSALRVLRAWSIALVVALAAIPAAGQSRQNPLTRVGLATDPESAMRYLTEGLPSELVAPEPEPGRKTMPARLPFERWNLHVYAIGAVAESKSPDAAAVLSRLIDEPLPPVMAEDLVMSILGDRHTWEDWDQWATAETAALRGYCARELRFFEPDASVAPLRRLIVRARKPVEIAMQDDRDHLMIQEYAFSCGMVAASGQKEGMDTLVALLPMAEKHRDIALVAESLAGPAFPLFYTPPKDEYLNVARQWQDWWSINRDSIVVTLKNVPPLGPTTSVRDYVAAEQVRYMSVDLINSVHPEARAWLEANAINHAEEIRKVADDEHEPIAVRHSAARWLLSAGGPHAEEWIKSTMLRITEEPAFTEDYLLTPWLRDSPPELAETLAREAVERQTPAAGAGAAHLLRLDSDEARAFVLKHYPALAGRFPSLRRHAVLDFQKHPTPGDSVVIEDCLIHGDRSTAVSAISEVRRRGIEAELSEEARLAYERWLQDPHVRLGLLSGEQDKTKRETETASIVRETRGTDANAAQIFMSGYMILTDRYEGPVTPDAQYCLDRLHECIEAYRESRGGIPEFWAPARN